MTTWIIIGLLIVILIGIIVNGMALSLLRDDVETIKNIVSRG